jgi:hypothetical protein
MRDLRNGLNTLDLQRHKQLVSRDKREPIEKVLSGIAGHYEQKQKSRDAQPNENLLKALDHSLAAFVEAGTSSAIEGACRSMTALRYTLYPDAASLPVAAVAGAEGTAKEHAA